MLKANRALISVYDKRGVVDLAAGLADLGIELISTGGTYRELEAAGIPVIPVAEVTGFPEILDGRVKTLHPHIHGGILADRSRAAHLSQLRKHSISLVDVVVVNLYPFQETVANAATSFVEAVEMIDIGGPCMVRAAAKNHQGVVVVVDPDDYPQVLAALEEGDREVPTKLRRRLALKAFRHTQSYDAAIATWLESQIEDTESEFPGHRFLDLEKEFEPRYGENPHQRAALYRMVGSAGIFGGFEQLHGKDLSFNNLLDTDAARRLAAQFDDSTVVAIVKHNNPCGVGRGSTVLEAYERALACDPVSAFGSVVAVNTEVDEEAAQAMAELFIEVITAPAFDRRGMQRLTVKKNLRLLRAPVHTLTAAEIDMRSIEGGFLAQTADAASDDSSSWTCATKRSPTDDELSGLDFMWKVVRQVKSNAIVIGNQIQTVGIGAGQMSRVDSCRLSIDKANLETAGCVGASDAFFPFPDGLEVLADAGVTAIVQPGGSKRDDEVVEAADRRGLAMLFTGHRHFRH